MQSQRSWAKAMLVGGLVEASAPWNTLTGDLIAASIHDKYSVSPSIRPVYTRCCFTMTNMIQVCSIFYWARIFIMYTRPNEIFTIQNVA